MYKINNNKEHFREGGKVVYKNSLAAFWKSLPLHESISIERISLLKKNRMKRASYCTALDNYFHKVNES